MTVSPMATAAVARMPGAGRVRLVEDLKVPHSAAREISSAPAFVVVHHDVEHDIDQRSLVVRRSRRWQASSYGELPCAEPEVRLEAVVDDPTKPSIPGSEVIVLRVVRRDIQLRVGEQLLPVQLA